MCESDFLSPTHAGLLTVIKKRLQGKKFTSSIHSKHYLWFTGGFKNTRLKWQILPLFRWSNGRMLSASGVFAPWTHDQGLCPWTPLGALPSDPRYRLALCARHESYSRLLSAPLFSTWRRPCLLQQHRSSRQLRSSGHNLLEIRRMKTSFAQCSFTYSASHIWNSQLRDVTGNSNVTPSTFKKKTENVLLH